MNSSKMDSSVRFWLSKVSYSLIHFHYMFNEGGRGFRFCTVKTTVQRFWWLHQYFQVYTIHYLDKPSRWTRLVPRAIQRALESSSRGLLFGRKSHELNRPECRARPWCMLATITRDLKEEAMKSSRLNVGCSRSGMRMRTDVKDKASIPTFHMVHWRGGLCEETVVRAKIFRVFLREADGSVFTAANVASPSGFCLSIFSRNWSNRGRALSS